MSKMMKTFGPTLKHELRCECMSRNKVTIGSLLSLACHNRLLTIDGENRAKTLQKWKGVWLVSRCSSARIWANI
jgi:hypothetical protein